MGKRRAMTVSFHRSTGHRDRTELSRKLTGALHEPDALADIRLQPCRRIVDRNDHVVGAADGGIPNETVEQMRAALKAAGKKSDITLYPDTPHGFYADYRPSYRKATADDAWAKLTAWFKANGVA